MELNKIKLLKKEVLLQKLKQSGFDEVAKILEDKDVDGHTLIELEFQEFKMFKWKLSPSQKQSLWNCIKEIKNKPSILTVQQNPKVAPKPVPAKAEYVEKIEQNMGFKNKLQDLLGSSATSVGSSSTLPKTAKPKPFPSLQNQNKPSEKPLPPPPPPSPPLRNNAVTNTNIGTKKSPVPLPVTNDDEYYLQMNPPPNSVSQNPNKDYYLAPIDPPSPQKNKNKSPNLPKRNISKEESETYENVYELSPPGINISRNRSLPNIPDRVSATADEDIINDYVQFPSENSSSGHISGSKTNLKDPGNALVDKNVSQPESSFSFWNIFKRKNTYENYKIQGEKRQSMKTLVKNRPLPDIPVSLISIRSKPDVLFSRPFPPPRETSSQDNYVELVNDFPGAEQHSVTKEIDDENQIYVNTTDEQELIYENASKKKNPKDEEQIYDNPSDIHGIGGLPPKQVPLITEFKGISRVESPVKTNQNINRAQGLAFMLSQKIMERDQRQHQRQPIVENETESEFEDEDLPDYGNILNVKEIYPFPIPDEKIIEDIDRYSPRIEDKKIPKYKRTLPEIPKDNASPKATVIKIPSSSNKSGDSIKAWATNNFNGPTKGERTVTSTSKPGTTRLVNLNYEHHAMNSNKQNENQQRHAGIKFSKEEESRGDNICGLPPKQVPQITDFKGISPVESPVKANQNINHVQALALLLSQQLKDRDERHQQQKQQPIVENQTDSEFEDEELPEYGNILNDNGVSPFPIPSDEKIIEDVHRYPPHIEDKKIPIYKRTLPEIPKDNASPKATVTKIPSPSNKRGDSIKVQAANNFNGPIKGERAVISESKAGSSKLVNLNYEHHIMKNIKINENQEQPAKIEISDEEEEKHGGNIFNLSEEPFYREVDRKGANQILSSLGNGAFLFRPSRTYFLSLTVKHNNRIYNCGIERSPNKKLRLNTMGNVKSPEFSTLREFVAYFTEEPVTFEKGNKLIEIYLKTYL